MIILPAQEASGHFDLINTWRKFLDTLNFEPRLSTLQINICSPVFIVRLTAIVPMEILITNWNWFVQRFELWFWKIYPRKIHFLLSLTHRYSINSALFVCLRYLLCFGLRFIYSVRIRCLRSWIFGKNRMLFDSKWILYLILNRGKIKAICMFHFRKIPFSEVSISWHSLD